MAVTTTPQEIMDAAYAKSLKNNPGQIATEATELFELVNRAIRAMYILGARVNQTFFAEMAAVSFSVDHWPRPETAESIFYIEDAGAEVVVVPFNDRAAEAGIPALYRFGQKFYGAGNVGDPTSGDLDFFYSKRPTTPANKDTALDALWTEQFNELLILEVAIYLAIKDDRGTEIQNLRADRDSWAKMFVMFMEHETTNERRRFGHVKRINTETILPLTSILAGGTNLDI